MANIRKEYTEIKKYEEIRKDNKKQNETVTNLQEKVRYLEQYSRRRNLEISGVPETKGKNALGVIRDVETADGI